MWLFFSGSAYLLLVEAYLVAGFVAEQMNVYLRLLVKPHKKEKLLVSNNVLKLACKLLKVRF